jgi:hypothetical protein
VDVGLRTRSPPLPYFAPHTNIGSVPAALQITSPLAKCTEGHVPPAKVELVRAILAKLDYTQPGRNPLSGATLPPSRRARTRSIGSPSRARGSSLILTILPAAGPPRPLNLIWVASQHLTKLGAASRGPKRPSKSNPVPGTLGRFLGWYRNVGSNASRQSNRDREKT